MLPIAGFQGTSLIDFPGKISSIIFLAGCDLRCPYCHNASLFEVNRSELIKPEEVIGNLEKRKRFIDGVVVTGGEPTLYPDLLSFLKEIKEKVKILIKLDSNGLNPGFLEKAFPWVDYFAIDLKTVPELYPSLGTNLSVEEVENKLLQTKKLFENSGKGVEYRTTMYPPVVRSYEALYKMYKLVPKNADYYLQRFIPDNSWCEEASNTVSYTPDQLERMALELRKDLNSEKIYLRTYS